MAGRTIIVGAGAAGLAVAAMLGRRGVAYELLERADAVGSAWRNRYDSLQLHTARWLSGLPGAPIPRRSGLWVGRDDLVDYLESYARRFDIQPDLGIEVRRIDLASDGWRVKTSSGTRTASHVVLTTGVTRTPYLPDWPGREAFTGTLSHSVSYREPSAYRGRRVLVVGAGNSATEIAVEVSRVAAEVQLSVRTPPNIVRRATFGLPSQVVAVALSRLPARVLDPVLGALRRLTIPDLTAYGLPAPTGGSYSQFVRSRTIPILDHGFIDAVRERRIAVIPAVEELDGAEVRLTDGRTLRPDAVIAATGYRPDLGALVGHLGVLDGSGLPQVRGADTVPEAPGLYFVGLSPELSGALRRIGQEARAVARAIAG